MVFSFITIWVEKYHVGAQGEEWSLSFLERFLVAGRAIWFYAWKLVWPFNLSFIYSRWTIDSNTWWQYAFPAAVVAALGALWQLRRRLGKAPLAAVLFFAGTLVPALGFFNIYPHRYSYVADHFQYLASIGLITLIVSGAALIIRRFGPGQRQARYSVFTVVLLALGLLCGKQALVYHNLETLWRDTISKTPDAAIAYNNLGLVVLDKDVNEALRYFNKALSIKPHDAEAHSNIGTALEMQGRPGEAILYYNESLKIKPHDAKVNYNLGIALEEMGRTEDAVSSYRASLRIDPNEKVHNNLGVSLVQLGKLDEALEHFQEALMLNPNYEKAEKNRQFVLKLKQQRGL